MRYLLKYSCMTHVGQIRLVNQDNYICNGEFKRVELQSLSEPIAGQTDTDIGAPVGNSKRKTICVQMVP